MLNIFFRLSETFDRFEIKSKLEDQMLDESNDKVDEMESAPNPNQSVREATETNQQNISESGEQYQSK